MRNIHSTNTQHKIHTHTQNIRQNVTFKGNANTNLNKNL